MCLIESWGILKGFHNCPYLYQLPSPLQAVSGLTLLYGAGVSSLYQLLTTYLALLLISAYTFIRFQGDIKPMLKLL